jgi:hypothetical protein
MNEDDTPPVFGDLEMAGKDIAVAALKFDRLALSGRGELLLVSVVAETHRVKQVRAILGGGAKAQINAAGVKVNQPGADPWRATSPGRLFPTPDGYQCFTHKLGYGLAHALFLTRMPGFMRVVTPESLWHELKHVRFTTPIIPEWMPHIEKQLRDESLLEDAHSFNCQCGVLTAQTRHLDDIVTQGIRRRHLTIPTPPLA